MNAATHTEHQEYEASMQLAALFFLQRHQSEHLGNDQLLFSRAVQHLTGSLEVPLHMAEKLVTRAYGELKCSSNRHQLDVDASSTTVAVVTDPSSGLTWAVPVNLIYERIINATDNRRLRLVTP
ncbi:MULTISPECIES: hypothetical protein [Pseudomonas]|uniref:Prophage PssSM-01 n=1 Tax=Pseudomonas lundensis TaxID=86185 RepID=A0AAX2HBT2_9PSED|nr:MULTISPECIES: hypothetical protein [Pseudomonas]MBM1189200.1 hypothetical protein [Pseudomonas lundensis]NMY74420.1 hypothetical protein [Pseudomonas sp. WS 5071]NMZ97457.1 hypothetical protein [Pseudomonas lundensis]NNA32651.1 hypothetical protein [Pseudomonas lundensis]SOB53787.1 conserved hypothetical protein [Pseudomonas lundensis]